MMYITLRQFVDDILLLVRNNNISESEDLSRELIRLWVKTYKKYFIKQRLDKHKQYYDTLELLLDNLGIIDEVYIKEIGPIEIEDVPSLDNVPMFTKRTKNKLLNVYENEESSILAVHDQSGENIQQMNHIRRHYHFFRKYTKGELTFTYDDGNIVIRGYQDLNKLKYIWVKAIFEEPDNENEDNSTTEDNIKIPMWLVPLIKDAILSKELAFMLNRPSDDSNNSTLASVKPHGPQDDEE